MELGSPQMVDLDNNPEPERKDTDTRPATYAVNALYTAFSDHRGVFVRKLSGRDAYRRLFRYEEDRPWFEPILAFFSTRLNLLAIATGLQILIFDVESSRVRYALKGNGRVVTSVAFCKSKSSVLATGHVDGSICVWSLKHPERPVRHLRAFHGACSHVVFSDYDADLIAGCHYDCISVWSLPSTRPVLVTKSDESGLKSLHWFSSQPERVIGISVTGSVSIYNVHDALKTFRTAASALENVDDSDDEHPVFGELDDVGHMPSIAFDLGFRISQALLVGRNGLIVLPHKGHKLFFVTFMADHDHPTELWRLRLDAQVDCFTLRYRSDTVEVVACFDVNAHAYEVPTPVLDGMGWVPGMSIAGTQNIRDLRDGEGGISLGSMRPELSLYQRIAKPPSMPSPGTESSPRPLHQPTPRKKASHKVHSETSRSATPTPRSMTSSLELPKPHNGDLGHDSPMPFLSPSIPAKKPSPTPAFTPLDDVVRLPPRASFDSITSSLDHDSDSDDETFPEIMQGSGSFLPGGVNVPLPRTCGAAFGPNGQLLTFFPSKVKPSFAIEDVDIEGQVEFPKLHSREVQKLFQGFGNLASPTVARRQSTGSESEHDAGVDGRIPYFAQRLVLDPQVSWSAKVSPTKPTSATVPTQQRVFVAVRELRTMLQPQRVLADEYRILPDHEQSIPDVCLTNAGSADSAGLEELANLWRSLALITEPKKTLKPIIPGDDGEPLTSDLFPRPVLSRNPSMSSNYAEGMVRSILARLCWSQHPLGKTWAVAQILQWAERQADVQLLAHASALLIQASEALGNDAKSLSDQVQADINSAAERFAEFAPTKVHPSKLPPGLPILRAGTDFTDVSTSDDSPVKARSQASSRDPSQPTTPYLDSSSSTPPIGLPYLNRQGSKLSTSGSISPETHRTSFSSAAKYYAQTITDKLSSYGSSPPLKKMQAGSPSANELSSSLPNNTPGSWSKSVSFASATDTARDSRRSLSLAQEDDDYDSDKTIDDASLPHTPKPSGAVHVRSNNGLFWDELTTSLESAFLPEQHVEKCQVWRDTYAEQLRAWDLLLEAAELENIADQRQAPRSEDPSAPWQIKPLVEEGRRKATCSICFCMIQAAEQMCSACLHTTHLECLDNMLSALGHIDFTCPTGCGCQCTALTEICYGLVDDRPPSSESLAEEVPLRPPFLKKMSLTDPRSLRDRLQGESW